MIIKGVKDGNKGVKDTKKVDSPTEGTMGGNQADLGPGSLPSVADQSMENDCPIQYSVCESTTLYGITIYKMGHMGLTLLKTKNIISLSNLWHTNHRLS